MHRAGEADADDDPDQSGRVAELRGEHRTDERSGAGDRGEVMTEQHPSRRDVVVVAVGPDVRGRRAAVVERHDARGEERAVIPVGERQNPEDGEDDVEGPHSGRFYPAVAV